MRRTWFSMTLVLLVIVLLLSACGGDPASGNSGDNSNNTGVLDANKKYTVDFWEAFSTGANKTAIENLSKQYMSQHKNVTIKLQAFDSYDTLKTKLTAAIAANNTPTMAQVYESWASKYQQSNALESLQPYISGKNGLSANDVSDFYPTIWKDGQIDGTQYMLPFNKSVEVLYYNEDVLKQEGIAVPTTTDELKAAITKVTKADGSRWGLSFTPSVDEWATLYKAFGGADFVSSDGTKAAFGDGANAQPALKALSDLTPLVKAGNIHVTKLYSWQNDFAAGKSAFAISTVASYPFIKSSIGGKFNFSEAVLPSGSAGKFTSLYGTNMAMFSSASTDAKTAAWDFMKYLTSADANAQFVKATGYMPIRKSAYEGSTLKSYFEQNPARQAGPESLQYGFVPSILPAWDDCRTVITSNFTSALTSQLSENAALQKMTQGCSTKLAEG
ncbi:ABC transporter substrate-binding protein [Ktedonobacter sp. SOSP1-85]|uniref:ABC transporter substrate-binding protein n=1 Tax=Ktedonobacter sp. SOSP1-85 TaxID=2778367 RepID=UPI001915404E|nr:ABC transporter substrate-binding protein [Ktedonobacter sp. SOSP1-85]GHO80693.1 ABC transporter substrate-binding protein [Ktedonobacter sp. SOSP1-85]